MRAIWKGGECPARPDKRSGAGRSERFACRVVRGLLSYDCGFDAGCISMSRTLRTIACLLIAVQAWVAVSGGGGGVGCVRFWACLSEPSVESDDGCSCCRGERSDEAPPTHPLPPLPTSDPDHEPGCCVHLPDLMASPPRHDLADGGVGHFDFAFAAIGLGEAVWTPVDDRRYASTWLPPPDPGAVRVALGLRTTRLMI